MTTMARHPREALELAIRAAALLRGGADRIAILAALDQTRASVRYEPYPTVARTLSWVCRAVEGVGRHADIDETGVDAALRVAAHDLDTARRKDRS